MSNKIGTTEPKAIKIWSTAVKKVMLGSTQIRPAWWQPWANTLLYLPLKNDILDHSGNNRTITNNGVTISWWLWVFDGSSYLDLGTENRTNFQKLTNWTISIWAKRTVDPVSWYNSYFIWKAKMHPATPQNILYWIWYGDDKNLVAGVFSWNSWSPTPVPYGSSINIAINTWYNIILVKAWTTKTIYMNGTQAATWTANDTTSTDNIPLTIGSATYYNSTSYITGNMSDVIIEDKARTATEITDYYNLTKWNYWL